MKCQFCGKDCILDKDGFGTCTCQKWKDLEKHTEELNKVLAPMFNRAIKKVNK